MARGSSLTWRASVSGSADCDNFFRCDELQDFARRDG